MKILIVRHGDPDYENDTLTEKGWREARLLCDRLKKLPIKDFYVSPMGRAKDTASLTLQAFQKEAVEEPWLEEFVRPRIRRPDRGGELIHVWDWYPEDWMSEEVFYDKDRWYTHPIMEEGHVKEYYDWVADSLDELLDSYGYHRNGSIYTCEEGNSDTIAFFCHFGVECVLLSHLMNISPMVLWHMMFACTTSVTTVQSEERAEGKAIFRVLESGDASHLDAAGEPRSDVGHFPERYDPEYGKRPRRVN